MDVFMQGEGITDRERLHLISMYALYLKDIGLVPRDYFQSLAGDFSARHYPDAIFSDPMVMLARSTTMRWQGRALSIAAEARQKGAVTFDMLQDMFTHLWDKGVVSGASEKHTDELMAFISGLATFNWGLRISETAKTMSDKDFIDAGPQFELDQHAAKAEDIMLAFTKVPQGDQLDEGTLEWLSAYACSQSSLAERSTRGPPQASGLAVRTSKTNPYGSREVRHLVLRGCAGENWLVDGLYFIANLAQYHAPTDMFFSRIAAKGSRSQHPRKRLHTNMVGKVIKDCASRMGLSPKLFSTKSFKVGGITGLKALGDSQPSLLTKMDHKTASASLHYQRSLLGPAPVVSLLEPGQGPLGGGELGYRLSTYRTDLALTSGISSSSLASSVRVTSKKRKPDSR